jgi:hypothetical protein
MAVIDTSALASMAKQISALKEQIMVLWKQLEAATQILSTLTEVRDAIQEQIDAIGELGEILLPLFNIAKIAEQLKSDAQCLMPDYSKLMPGAEFEDFQFDSICSARAAYDKLLWLDPKEAKNKSWEEQKEMRITVQVRRRKLLRQIATDGLANADVAISATVDDQGPAVDDLERAARAAKNMNTRLQVIAEGQVLVARQLATQNQLLAQMLKVQSAQLTGMVGGTDGKPLEGDDE